MLAGYGKGGGWQQMVPKRNKAPKQGPPVSFRPGQEIEALGREFARHHHMPRGEAFKNLATLAICEFDVRFHDLFCAMSASGGPGAFAHAVLRSRAALTAYAKGKSAPIPESERARLVLEFAISELGSLGVLLPADVVALFCHNFAIENNERNASRTDAPVDRLLRKKRKIRQVNDVTPLNTTEAADAIQSVRVRGGSS